MIYYNVKFEFPCLIYLFYAIISNYSLRRLRKRREKPEKTAPGFIGLIKPTGHARVYIISVLLLRLRCHWKAKIILFWTSGLFNKY